MKILLLHQYYLEEDDSGGSRWNEMTRMWSDKGHDITVVAGMIHSNGFEKRTEYKGKYFYKKQTNRINIWRCHVSESYNLNFLGRLWGYFSFVFSSLWCLLFKVKGKYDVIIITSPPLFISISAMVYSWLKRTPMIFEIRDLWPESAIDTGVVRNKLIIKLAYWLERISYKNASLINVLTPAFRDALIEKKNINPNKIIYIPNAADFDISDQLVECNVKSDIREKYQLQDKFIITYVGAHGVANCLGQVLDTAKLLYDTKVVFILIGNGMEKPALLKRVEDENIHNVIFIDSVPKTEVFKYILSSDMGASILKKAEAFKTVYSNKTFDYFACKRPVFMLIDGVSRKLVEEASAGIYVEPENPEAFANAINEYLNDANRIYQEGQNGYEFAKENFDRTVLSEKYLNYILALKNKNV
jgi:glycosyltransferase involved in cell wall biosynthesis